MRNFDKRLIEFLSQNGGATRSSICVELFGHPTRRRSTVYDHLKKLELAGVVERNKKKRTKRVQGEIIRLPGRAWIIWSVVGQHDD